VIRVLYIEDQVEAEEKFRARMERLPAHVNVTIARSRVSAIEALNLPFDLVVCDLRIPTIDGALDDAEEHGWYVLDELRIRQPGTPGIVLTGIADAARARRWMRRGHADAFGNGTDIPTNEFFSKDDWEGLMAAVERLAAAIESLTNIKIDNNANEPLEPDEERVIRVHVSRQGGAAAVVDRRFSGHSGSKSFGVTVTNDHGDEIEHLFVKIGRALLAAKEVTNYEQHISHLEPGTMAQMAGHVTRGCGLTGGVVYALAATYRDDLYSILSQDPDGAALVARRLDEMQGTWRASAARRHTTVRQVRRQFVTDLDMDEIRDELRDIPWQAYEDSELDAIQLVQHRDMHGSNALVNRDMIPILIDAGNAGVTLGAIDAVSMELSVVLQESGETARGAWPSAIQATAWLDLAQYLEGCPFPDFVRACRAWALKSGASSTEIAALAYAYSLRQLLYPDTNHALALAVITGICGALNRQDG
jgi:CheY-like chemotaxis protein